MAARPWKLLMILNIFIDVLQCLGGDTCCCVHLDLVNAIQSLSPKKSVIQPTSRVDLLPTLAVLVNILPPVVRAVEMSSFWKFLLDCFNQSLHLISDEGLTPCVQRWMLLLSKLKELYPASFFLIAK